MVKSQASGHDWDWSKRNDELAIEHGVSYSYVSQLRWKHGAPKVTKYYPACLEWDWSKSDADLARQLGIEMRIIAAYRNKLEKPLVPNNERAPALPKWPVNEQKLQLWQSWDWTKPDISLAKEYGLSRERIRQIRVRLNKPKALFYEGRFKAFAEHFKDRKTLSYAEMVAAAPPGFSFPCRTIFRNWCLRAGILPTNKKIPPVHPWHLLNFELPNKLLAKIWDIPCTVVAARRCNFRQGPAKFYAQEGMIIPFIYNEMINAEKEKAQAWKAGKTATVKAEVTQADVERVNQLVLEGKVTDE